MVSAASHLSSLISASKVLLLYRLHLHDVVLYISALPLYSTGSYRTVALLPSVAVPGYYPSTTEPVPGIAVFVLGGGRARTSRWHSEWPSSLSRDGC
jgi:hypothetical protein